jgi:membrane protein
VNHLKEVKNIVSRFITGFMKHDLMTLAAALAFYTALSLAPLLLLIIAVIGLIGPEAQNQFLVEVQSLMGNDASSAVKMIVNNASKQPQLRSFAGIVGVLTLLFSASGVFSQLQASLNVIWETEAGSTETGWVSYLRKRLFSMGLVIALAFLSVVSLAASTVLAAVFPSHGEFWQAIDTVVSIAVFSYLFALVFKYLPDMKISWRHVLSGGVFTSVLFSIGKTVIGLYLGKSAIGSAYGAAGSLIVLLVWVYYSSIIVFMGAEFTRAAFTARKEVSVQDVLAKNVFAPV